MNPTSSDPPKNFEFAEEIAELDKTLAAHHAAETKPHGAESPRLAQEAPAKQEESTASDGRTTTTCQASRRRTPSYGTWAPTNRPSKCSKPAPSPTC